MSESLLQTVVRRYGADALAGMLSPEQLNALRYEWQAWARPEQLAPIGAWLVWLLMAGRGFGKSRTGAEWVRSKAESMPGTHGALVAPTAADARDVMVKALLGCSMPGEVEYEPSKRSLTWANGTTATLYTAEEPDRLRGPQHAWAWCDELAAWAYPEDTWDMLQMTMRLGDTPQVCVSTTPRPIPIVRRLMADGGTVITRGSTYDNAANLSPAFLAAVKERYEGTRLGRQELYAEILDDVPGALWTRGMLESARVKTHPVGLRRIVVAVDPSGGHDAENDEQGIIVAGLGQDGLAYVLEDATCKLSPEGWGRRVVDAYVRHEADRVLWERNFGGEMVEHVITTAAKAQGVTVSTREVKASRGKVVRAEPIAALYEQCVAAGSLISTALGELRIEDIAAGDMVWTRAGLRRVLWAGQTGIKPTLIIRPSVGAALVCTGDHPVYIDGRGYISARDIVPKCDKLIQWEPGQGVLIAASRSASPAGVVSRVRRLVGGLRTGSHFGRSSNSTVDAITLTARAIGALAGTPGIVCFIGTSGRWPTDQYQTGGTCTTLTATQGTTRFQTSKRCHRATTSRSHMVAEGLAPVRRGSRSASGQRPGGRRAGRQLTSANSASASSPRELLAYASVPPPAIRVSGIVSVENGPVLPVYNLTVEGEPEFFANGVLVHNCKVRHLGSFPQLEDQLCLFTPSGEFSKSPDRADALVWALTDLMLGEGAAVFVRHNPSPRRV